MRFDDARQASIYMLPQDIIDNTVKAFSVSATSPPATADRGAHRPLHRARITDRTASSVD